MSTSTHFNWSLALQSFYLMTIPSTASILYLTRPWEAMMVGFKVIVRLLCLCEWVCMREREQKSEKKGKGEKKITWQCDCVFSSVSQNTPVLFRHTKMLQYDTLGPSMSPYNKLSHIILTASPVYTLHLLVLQGRGEWQGNSVHSKVLSWCAQGQYVSGPETCQ